jgi:hypothetical protein
MRARFLILPTSMLLASAVAQAQPVCNDAVPLADQPGAAAAAAQLSRDLADEGRRARTWRVAWTAINGALTVGSFAPMPFVSREQWPDLVVSGVGSAISTVLTVAWPLEAEQAGRLPAPGSCAQLAASIAAAERAAADEAARVTWPWHLINAGVGGVYYAILGLGYGRHASGVLTGASAFVISEIQLFTQPTALARRWPQYWSVALGPGRGLGVRISW